MCTETLIIVECKTLSWSGNTQYELLELGKAFKYLVSLLPSGLSLWKMAKDRRGLSVAETEKYGAVAIHNSLR